MKLLVDPHGVIRCIYEETIDLTTLGELTICRVSMVEPDLTGRWWADLKIMGGPRLGPYPRRSAAVTAEIAWIEQRMFGLKDQPNGE